MLQQILRPRLSQPVPRIRPRLSLLSARRLRVSSDSLFRFPLPLRMCPRQRRAVLPGGQFRDRAVVSTHRSLVKSTVRGKVRVSIPAPRVGRQKRVQDQAEDSTDEELLREARSVRSKKKFYRMDLVSLRSFGHRLRRRVLVKQVQRKESNVLSLWQRFSAAQGLGLTEESAYLFLVQQAKQKLMSSDEASLSTTARYGAVLLKWAKRKGWPCRRIAQVISVAEIGPAGIPDSQDPGIPRRVVWEAIRILPAPLNAVLWLAWKTASRFMEISRLVPLRHFHRSATRPAELVITWLETSKIGRRHPFSPANVVHVVAVSHEERALLRTLLEMPFNTPLVPRGNLMEVLKSHCKCLLPYTARSVKRGARLHLSAHPMAVRVSKVIVSRLMKHKSPSEPMAATTVRYHPDRFQLGVELGTGLLTMLL